MRRCIAVGAACAALFAAIPAGASAASGGSPSLRATTHTVRVGSIRLGYRAFGSGPPLVMVMGYAGTIDVWDPALTDALARHHRVVVFYNRGVGRSTGAPSTISVPTMADDTARLIRALRLGRPDVLGWSMGGFIAQSLAVRHPRSLRRLVLAASGPRFPRFIPSPDGAALLFSPISNVTELLGLLFPPDQGAARDAWITRLVRRKNLEQIAPAVLEGQRRAVLDWSTKPGVENPRRIPARTFAADGAEDRLIPPANSRALARAIRGARLKIYPDAAHGFLFQEHAPFARAVERFLGVAR